MHILVNNAGATWGAPLEEFPASAWDKVVDLNLKAPFHLTRACLPMLRRRPRPTTRPGSSTSAASTGCASRSSDLLLLDQQGGVHQLTRVLAKELGPRHVTVNAIAPGPFESKMMAATLEGSATRSRPAPRSGRIGRPDDMAGTAVFLSSRAGSYVTGAVIPVDGGIWAAR